MRALTVQQPWAWAIVHGGKGVENRTQAWRYRGSLAIHAGQRLSERGFEFGPMVEAFLAAGLGRDESVDPFPLGAIIGVVDLVDVHRCELVDTSGVTCCRPWGERRQDRWVVHLVVENPRPLEVPIRCRGALGLWTPPAEVLAELERAVA